MRKRKDGEGDGDVRRELTGVHQDSMEGVQGDVASKGGHAFFVDHLVGEFVSVDKGSGGEDRESDVESMW
jgi:hypothetical protein